MATLTIRNLPQPVHDGLRRAAAANRRSMEDEARQLLDERYGRSEPDWPALERRLAALQAELPSRPSAYLMDTVDKHLALKRIDALFEESLLTLEERNAWDDRIESGSVDLAEVQSYFERRWPWWNSSS
jgi:plasmid stability protein